VAKGSYKQVRSRYRRSPQIPGRHWWVALAAAYMVLLWNWQLLLAIGVGGLSAIAAHQGIGKNWWQYRRQLLQIWQQSDPKFFRAVGIGGFATLATYLIFTSFISLANFWLVIALLLQVLGIFAIWLRLGKPTANRHTSPQTEFPLQQKLSELSDGNAITRLIAVRQLPQLVRQSPTTNTIHIDSRRLATDALRLMLKQEPEPIVRKAITESLRLLGSSHSLHSGKQPPVSLPLRQKQRQRSKTPQEID